jgi:hypothetical protein
VRLPHGDAPQLTANAVQIVHRDDEDRITESWFMGEDQQAVDESLA